MFYRTCKFGVSWYYAFDDLNPDNRLQINHIWHIAFCVFLINVSLTLFCFQMTFLHNWLSTGNYISPTGWSKNSSLCLFCLILFPFFLRYILRYPDFFKNCRGSRHWDVYNIRLCCMYTNVVHICILRDTFRLRPNDIFIEIKLLATLIQY